MTDKASPQGIANPQPHFNFSLDAIMPPQTYSVSLGMSVKEAISLLLEKKIGGAPVVDLSNVVVSIATEGDLLKLAATVGLEAKIVSCLNHLAKPEKLVTANRQIPFIDLYRLFLTSKVHRVLIVDMNMKLQGIVSRSTILRVLVDSDSKKKAS